MSNAEYRKRPVWKLKGAENTECGNGKFKLKIYTVFKKCANNFDRLSFMKCTCILYMKHVKWDQVLIPGCLNVPEGALKGSLGRGVPQKPSKPDPL